MAPPSGHCSTRLRSRIGTPNSRRKGFTLQAPGTCESEVVLCPQAEDSCPMELTIRLTDENDNGPVFNASSYTFTIQDSITQPTRVGVVRAQDADAGDNARLEYTLTQVARRLNQLCRSQELLSGRDAGGRLGRELQRLPDAGGGLRDHRSLRALRRLLSARLCVPLLLSLPRGTGDELGDGRERYGLSVMARDGGETPREATARVTVVVNFLNSRLPEFTQAQYAYTHLPNSSGPTRHGLGFQWGGGGELGAGNSRPPSHGHRRGSGQSSILLPASSSSPKLEG